jgi:cell division protein FtsZ
MHGARGVLINITGGLDMTLFEVDEAANRIRKEVDEDANVIFGSSVDESMNGRLRVSVVATGIDAREAREAERPKLVAMGGGSVQAVASAPMPGQGGAQGASQGQPMPPSMRAQAGFAPRVATGSQPAQMRPAQTYAAPQGANQGANQPAPVQASAAQMADTPVSMAQPGEAPLRAQAQTRQAAPMPPAQPGGFKNLFRHATGLMRRDVEVPAPQAPQPARQEPQAAPRPVAAPTQQDEMGLDIPTFLRRQSN